MNSKDIEKVLIMQNDELSRIQENNKLNINKTIEESESLLKTVGVDVKGANNHALVSNKDNRVILVPTWNELVNKARQEVDEDRCIETLFTEEELKDNSAIIKQINNDYNNLHKLDLSDYVISSTSGLLASLIDLFFIAIPHNDPKMAKEGSISKLIKDWFDKKYPEEKIKKIETLAKVPFDAQDNRNLGIDVKGLSSYYHRLLELGHDPVIGFIVGVLDIMNGNITTIDKTGKFVVQKAIGFDDRTERNIFLAIAKEINHLSSDINTSMGLPVPFMALFNKLQILKIGSDEQTIAEIVQGMYYEGYDFKHFISMSIPTMIAEVTTRLFYSLKKINSGYRIKESIPISLNREKNPKLATMLFISHSFFMATNIGKVLITKDINAINYAECLAFAKYSFSQAKWVLIQKPKEREKHVDEWMYHNLLEIEHNSRDLFDEYTKEKLVVYDI